MNKEEAGTFDSAYCLLGMQGSSGHSGRDPEACNFVYCQNTICKSQKGATTARMLVSTVVATNRIGLQLNGNALQHTHKIVDMLLRSMPLAIQFTSDSAIQNLTNCVDPAPLHSIRQNVLGQSQLGQRISLLSQQYRILIACFSNPSASQ